MKINYFLRNPNLDSSTINLKFYIKRVAYKRSTGISIETKSWENRTKKVKRGYLNSAEINLKLKNIELEISNILFHDKSENIEVILKKIDNFLNNKTDEINSLDELFNSFIEERRELKDYSEGTLKVYITTLNKISNSISNIGNVSIKQIDYKYFMSFFNEMNADGIQNKTIHKYLRNIRHVLNWGLEYELHENLFFSKELKKVFQNFDFDSDSKFSLSDEELSLLENYNFESDKENMFCRDLFLIQTYLCLRYSELVLVNKKNIRDNKIFLYSKKTREAITRPLFPKVTDLILKYDFDNVKFLSEQKYNNRLKKISKIVGLNNETPIRVIIGRKTITTNKPKYEVISNHIARNTFITLIQKKGMLPQEVMAITGHKDPKVLQGYFKTPQEAVFEKSREIWR